MLVFFLVQAGKGQEVEWQEVEWQEPGLRRLNGRRFMIDVSMMIQLDEVWNVFFSFKGGGGVQGEFFGRINIKLWAPQVALFMRETFGEVPGLRRPIGSGPHPTHIYGSWK